jgi:hypothetical protein
VLRKLLPKIVRGYAIDAIDRSRAGVAANDEGAVGSLVGLFTLALAASACTSSPAVGLGTDVRLSGAGITGAALMTDHIVHLSAFTI